MAAWMAWGAKADDALVDFGSPTRPVSYADPGATGGVGGYSFPQANDVASLDAVLKGHSDKAMGTIEVLKVLPQPAL